MFILLIKIKIKVGPLPKELTHTRNYLQGKLKRVPQGPSKMDLICYYSLPYAEVTKTNKQSLTHSISLVQDDGGVGGRK